MRKSCATTSFLTALILQLLASQPHCKICNAWLLMTEHNYGPYLLTSGVRTCYFSMNRSKHVVEPERHYSINITHCYSQCQQVAHSTFTTITVTLTFHSLFEVSQKNTLLGATLNAFKVAPLSFTLRQVPRSGSFKNTNCFTSKVSFIATIVY